MTARLALALLGVVGLLAITAVLTLSRGVQSLQVGQR